MWKVKKICLFTGGVASKIMMKGGWDVFKKKKGQDRNPALYFNPISYEKPVQEYLSFMAWTIPFSGYIRIIE